MSLVRVVCAAIAAAAMIATAAAEPTVVATAEPTTAVDAALAPAPKQTVANEPDALDAPALGGPQASDSSIAPAAAQPAPEAAAPLAPPEPTLFADIDLGTQTMTVRDANGELGRWPISSARGGYKTPTGTFTPHYMARMHYSKQYDWAPMPYSVFISEGVATHGTNAIGNLGRPASHGCVRLHPKNAKAFFYLVQKHGMQLTQVKVHGKPPYSPVVAERRRPRYAQPSYQQFGFFGYSQAYQPKRAKKRYGGGYNTW
jgi:lipoprotein-anchoring transpeptidase ErfK/SrfK